MQIRSNIRYIRKDLHISIETGSAAADPTWRYLKNSVLLGT